jgi:sugar phosphate isomerase/epimerase
VTLKELAMRYSRRDLGRLALAAVPGSAVLRLAQATASPTAQTARPRSTFAGVQVGLNVPYNFGGRTLSGAETLRRTLELGINAVELRSQPVEIAMGSPGFRPAAEGAAAVQLPTQTVGPAERQAIVDAVRRWRAAAPMSAAEAFRRDWNDAGVLIEIVKYDGIYDMSDEEVDFAFRLANALGARAISTEIAAGSLERTRRIGQFADRHRIMVGYHGHTETSPAHWETVFGYATHNGANLDIGHFVAGHNTSPVPFLTQHHARITHLHIKDRKMGRNGGANTPFGQGDTPIVEVLRLVRDHRWPIQATIEFEYPVPAGSDRMAEMRRCIEYCRNALMTS